MKLYNKIGILALTAVTVASCAKNDPFADNMEIGQQLPTVSWELGSSTCKAGDNATFKAKYYFNGTDGTNDNIDHSEVWAMLTRSESSAATFKLVSSYSYSMTETANDTVRSTQMMKRYEHKTLTWNANRNIADFNKVYDPEGIWEDENGKYNSDYHIDRTNGYEYIMTGSIPTSQTLKPVSWDVPNTWDQEKFDQFYSKDFQQKFVTKVIDDLTKDSTYYTAMMDIYHKFPFTAEQIQALNTKHNVNFPTSVDDNDKKLNWTSFHTDEWKIEEGGKKYPATAKVGKYYITVENGVTYYHEVGLDYKNPDVKLYDVYDSAPWVFCRYDDDLGKVISTVRAQWMPFFRDMLSYIQFTDFIYDSSDKVYTVNFKRTYKLIPIFKVIGTNNKVGYTTDAKEIELN